MPLLKPDDPIELRDAADSPSGSPSASWRTLAALLALGLAVAVFVALRHPFAVPMITYFDDIRAWSPSTPIADTFTPLAYPLFAGSAFWLAGLRGLITMQALLYLATLALAFALLRLLEAPATAAGLGALLLLVHPDLFLSIVKSWDVGLSTFLFLLLVYVSVAILRSGATLPRMFALGAVSGAALFCRPNFALLAPAVLYAVWRAPGATSCRKLARLAASAALAAAIFALAGTAAHGGPFLPRNGPYNFYAGNNPFAAQTLLARLNAEPSLPPALFAAHPAIAAPNPPPTFYYSRSVEPVYTSDALHFILTHPGGELELIAIKLFTLFRPDTKVHGLFTPDGLVKSILALPAVVFLILLVAPRRPRLSQTDLLLLVFTVTYILPFLLTNSDPRFRTPLDGLLILHSVRLAWLRLAASPAAAAPSI